MSGGYALCRAGMAFGIRPREGEEEEEEVCVRSFDGDKGVDKKSGKDSLVTGLKILRREMEEFSRGRGQDGNGVGGNVDTRTTTHTQNKTTFDLWSGLDTTESSVHLHAHLRSSWDRSSQQKHQEGEEGSGAPWPNSEFINPIRTVGPLGGNGGNVTMGGGGF